MMSAIDLFSSNRAVSNDSKGKYASKLLRVLAFLAVIVLTVLALLQSMGVMWSQTGIHVLASLIYSTLIALPSMALLQWVSVRFTDRFPRLILLMQLCSLVCTALLGCLAGGLVLQFIGGYSSGAYWREFRSSADFAVVISLLIGMSTVKYETMRSRLQSATLELRTRQLEQERAYKLLAEAQLSSLESRLHPHFLFNTLNSIAALIPRDPQLAEDTVDKLGSLLRFSLSANHSGLIPLSQEVKIVRDYLEIEKTRFGSRLRYEIVVPLNLNDVKVPPLALQSLVENVVKHVISQRPEGATIQVSAFLSGSEDKTRIHLAVTDDGPGFSLDAITPEHGLGNLIARLELLFGSDGQLEVTREKQKTAVRLSFPA